MAEQHRLWFYVVRKSGLAPKARRRTRLLQITNSNRWASPEEASDGKGIEGDGDVQHKLMSILYVKRRQDANNPGVGSVELERLLGCPTKHLEFHLWYLKEKGWIRRLENGLLAITVEGVDRANSERRGTTTKFLTDQDRTGQGLHRDWN
jgi:hypothetical protein